MVSLKTDSSDVALKERYTKRIKQSIEFSMKDFDRLFEFSDKKTLQI
jgi:hypothetical protein